MHQFLDIEVTKITQGIHLSQGAYIKDIMQRLQMVDAKGSSTPTVSNCELSKLDGNSTIDGNYIGVQWVHCNCYHHKT